MESFYDITYEKNNFIEVRIYIEKMENYYEYKIFRSMNKEGLPFIQMDRYKSLATLEV